jgi:NADPH:quinone reductase-like Zn-dependent oxidoreductase
VRGWITDPRAPGGLRLATDLPEPQPAPGELVLGVWAYAVNRGELALLEQRPEGWRPGQDVAGVVARAAADGSGPAAGARVVGVVDGAGWSERVDVPTRWAAPLPEDVPFDQAAALPVAGLTALRALRVGGDLLGRRVLVTGATGGVGQFAVQLATAAGAHVTAQVGGPDRAEVARSLGARAVTHDLEQDGLGPFDLVLDGVGGRVLTQAVHVLAPGATAVTYGTLGGKAELGLSDFAHAPEAKVVGHFFAVPEATRGEDLAVLANLVADGRVRPLLGDIRSWEHTPEVLAALRERRIRGKAVLTR